MKKFFIFTFVALVLFLLIGVFVVKISIIHIQLPHGAVLHVLSTPLNRQKHGAVIICPGGGYSYLSKWHEGYMWFPFIYMQGYIPALLEYRMPRHDCKTPMVDGSEAIQMMRQHAREWHFAKNNVGIMGFSAGGHLASTIIVTDNDSLRPNFGILFYPVISMKKELTHIGSHYQLLGENTSEELENQYSNELHVSEKTPPVFIAFSNDDRCVDPQNSICFCDAMRAYNRPVALHKYPAGNHGWGYKLTFIYHRQMLNDLSDWLSKR